MENIGTFYFSGLSQSIRTCAHRATIIPLNDPSKLARFTFLGMAPVLVPLRPSSEHILIVRAPGARDQHGCHSTPFIVGALRARRMIWLLSLPSKLTHFTLPGGAPVLVYVRPSNEVTDDPSKLARYLSGMGAD